MYVNRVTATAETGINFAKWLPSFGPKIRPLLPGDLAVLLSDTGVGKTTILANVAYSQKPHPVLFFELELTPEDMCERFIAHDLQRSGRQIESDVQDGKRHNVDRWGNIYTCPQSKITIDEMEDIINKSELVIGQRPKLVLIDYIGLISGRDNKRYERMSNIAEGLKVMAKNTGTVVMLSSQIHRDKERRDISLHDAKDSGSIEASAQLVLGAWRPAINQINIKLLKCTKSAVGLTIECSFDGDSQTIREIRK
jgi:replicative DNA helicase